jgi:hypothetical protein
MRCVTWILAAAAALAAAGVAVPADTGDVKALIDRALQAAGGADRLAQPRAYSFKQEMTTKSKKNPAGVTSTATFYFQPPKKFRMEEEGQLNGRPVTYVEVINGNRGWGKRDGATRPLPPQAVAHPLEVQQGFGYKFVLALHDPAWKAAPLGESTVDGRAVVGVKLTHPVGRGGEERRLYFDAQTYLLAKSELRAKLSTGGEMATEQTWGDYKTIDGIAVPHHVTHVIKGSNEATVERTYSDFRFVDRPDPHLFDPP